jgi:hypothetical protein
MAFVEFCRFAWPEDSAKLRRVSILDVQAFKDSMAKHGGAPKTINRRISSLSSFYKFLSGPAAEPRLPITVPNPSHAQFISRESSDPVDETAPSPKHGRGSGPLFRPFRCRRGDILASRRMNQRSMYRVLMSYLERLPGAMHEIELSTGENDQVCVS